MNLSRQYEVDVNASDRYFNISIKIPKGEIEGGSKSAHEINMVFNQIAIFAEAMKITQNWSNQDTQKSLEKIVYDLKCLSNEICWIKAIHKGIKKALENSKHVGVNQK
jgi:hypothetical protein